MPKRRTMYFSTYCMKTTAVAVTAASTLAVFLLETTKSLLLFHIAPNASAQQQEDEGESGEQQQEENDIDLADLSTTMTGEQTVTNETAAVDQQIISTEIGDLTSADFETTRENLAAVRQGLLDNDSKAALDALNSADNSLFAVIISQNGSNEQLILLQTQIDSARDVLRNGDLGRSITQIVNYLI